VSVNNRRRKSGFLADYRLEERYLLKPNRTHGRPGVYAGYAPDQTPVLIKFWAKSENLNDSDLKLIWQHELRQLHRLAGYPGAADCIAHLYDAGYDKEGFYLILSPGQRRPLHSTLTDARDDHWLKQPRIVSNRSRMWANLKLLCQGLETLHLQGLLHRNLDTWSILTAGGSETDFQLTGFEWSMRVISGGDLKHKAPSKTQVQDSFLQDWKMFGEVAAELLGVKSDRLFDRKIPPFEIAEHITVEEARLLRNLTQVIPTPELNGDIVLSRIKGILQFLSNEIAGKDPKYHIAVRLGSHLSSQIREASDNEIEVDDFNSQLSFIVDDLQDTPLLLAIRIHNTDEIRLILRGKYLMYRLQEYRYRNNPPTWEFAYCEYSDKNSPVSSNILGQRQLNPSSIEILALNAANERFPRLRGKLSSWESLRKDFEEESQPLSREKAAHRALSLLQLIEALYASADVFPVELVGSKFATDQEVVGDGNYVLNVRTRIDVERDNLSKILNLQSPSVRLAKLLDSDFTSEGWILSDGSLGQKDPSATEWRFQAVDMSQGQPILKFSGTAPVIPLKDAFLVSASSIGRDVQFKRRLKALNALKDHNELLKMIADTRHRIIESHDLLNEDEAFDSLDIPKQQALKEIIATLPLYMVQGPPGVGKTRLVRDLVRRRFSDEHTSRLLLTAQSNAAIDHLMDELDEVVSPHENDQPLVVRCISKDSVEQPSRFDIREQAKQLVQQLANSKLAKELPSKLQHELAGLSATSLATTDVNNNVIAGRAASQALRAFEGLVARAANIVFATTNSAELERLIDERGQFDWAIVEEAAKATGSELISPLLLSHRRLMIGDHKQLPAFSSDQVKKLLEDPQRVKNALKVGEEFIGRSLRDETTEEIFDDVEDNEDSLPALCAESLRLLTFFETAIETEFNRQGKNKGGKPIAKKLTDQHRMHPTIADLVSRCFYSGDLKTNAECIKKFNTSASPFSSKNDSKLPSQPIVIIDMPYVQSELGQEEGDCSPAWHNPLEVKAVVKLLSLLEINENTQKPPTLALLSPYTQQVKRINTAIQENLSSLPDLQKFKSSSHNGSICHTVDSFQGSEADLVIVSLVRNNSHSSFDKAFGFLCDLRRMNVLLSRAKWQLVLVMSLEFMNEVVNAIKDEVDKSKIGFIIEMLQVIEDGIKQKSIAKVPFNHLMKE
jgi:serine/threonine protein kinase